VFERDWVGRWEKWEGAREDIDGWWWTVARRIGITELDGLSTVDDSADDRTWVDGSKGNCTAIRTRHIKNATFVNSIITGIT